ncbi:7a5027dc-b996-4c3d-a265-a5544382044a [Sclerotinia trifoliorum]|uniref:7a5027dc-b996-4c3d-a265-a5544382044a n=1 Tax=Sclerotinia trifoliorum TaxID=28548 RepID=A0A8H2ZNI2_9HELO|nr:7a5027dc-b996-4c3d-a265-a5544382044a [Sclerotinia trifoliorum]
MAELPNRLPSPPSATDIVDGIIDTFIDKLQLIWAENAAKGVVFTPRSRLALEIELALIRVVSATVAPEAVFTRISSELNYLNEKVKRDANPLLHDILLSCRDMMEQWKDEGWWEDLRSIEDSTRDTEDMGGRRNSGAYGTPTREELQRIQRLERTMFTDHQLRSRIDAHAQMLEESIARMKAEENDHGSESGLDDEKKNAGDHGDDIDKGDEDSVNVD